MKNSAIAIVYNQQGHLLVVKRRDVPIWVLPGGGIDEGETPNIAVVREVKEETGLTAIIIRQVAEYSAINRLSRSVYLFELQAGSGTLTTNDEVAALGFYPIDKLPKPFFLAHRAWIADAQGRHEGILRKPLHISYWAALKYGMRHPVLTLYYFRARLRRWRKEQSA